VPAGERNHRQSAREKERGGSVIRAEKLQRRGIIRAEKLQQAVIIRAEKLHAAIDNPLCFW
jgi:hypothetical protein